MLTIDGHDVDIDGECWASCPACKAARPCEHARVVSYAAWVHRCADCGLWMGTWFTGGGLQRNLHETKKTA